MTDDPNKKQGDVNRPGQQHDQQSGQQHKNPDDMSQKRPTQGGHDMERDQEKQDQDRQRKVS